MLSVYRMSKLRLLSRMSYLH